MNKSQHNNWKRDFLTIASGQTVSLIGSAAVQFSLIWWLASETASPLMMSIAGVCAFLPQLILGPFVGVWVDRLSRKNVIIAADLFIGLVALVFALFFMFDTPPYWSACVALGTRAVGNVFHSPAIQAAVPMLVPQHELVRANGWSQFMQSGAFLLGRCWARPCMLLSPSGLYYCLIWQALLSPVLLWLLSKYLIRRGNLNKLRISSMK